MMRMRVVPAPTGDPADTFKCLDCGKLASRCEIEQRVIRTNACGHCGGQVEPLANIEIAEATVQSAFARYKQLVRRAWRP